MGGAFKRPPPPPAGGGKSRGPAGRGLNGTAKTNAMCNGTESTDKRRNFPKSAGD